MFLIWECFFSPHVCPKSGLIFIHLPFRFRNQGVKVTHTVKDRFRFCLVGLTKMGFQVCVINFELFLPPKYLKIKFNRTL